MPANPSAAATCVRVAQRVGAEDLRRLHGPVPRAVGRLDDGVAVDDLERVDRTVPDDDAGGQRVGSRARRRSRDERGVTSGRAPSCTSTISHRSGSAREARSDRRLPGRAAGANATGVAQRERLDRGSRGTHRLGRRWHTSTIVVDRSGGVERRERPGEHRPAGDERELLAARTPETLARPASAHDRDRARAGSRAARPASSAACVGRAKIMRPAEVCSTDVTSTSISVADRRGRLDDDHRPVVEVADALVGLLALLGDLEADDSPGR